MAVSLLACTCRHFSFGPILWEASLFFVSSLLLSNVQSFKSPSLILVKASLFPGGSWTPVFGTAVTGDGQTPYSDFSASPLCIWLNKILQWARQRERLHSLVGSFFHPWTPFPHIIPACFFFCNILFGLSCCFHQEGWSEQQHGILISTVLSEFDLKLLHKL